MKYAKTHTFASKGECLISLRLPKKGLLSGSSPLYLMEFYCSQKSSSRVLSRTLQMAMHRLMVGL